jgi:hypothetical protein
MYVLHPYIDIVDCNVTLYRNGGQKWKKEIGKAYNSEKATNIYTVTLHSKLY